MFRCRFMRRLTSIQKGALVLAAVLLVGGGLMALFPSEVARTHPGEVTDAGVCFPEWTEHISKTGTRILGILATGLGVAIGWFSTKQNGQSATFRCTGPGAAGSAWFQWRRHWQLLPASER